MGAKACMWKAPLQEQPQILQLPLTLLKFDGLRNYSWRWLWREKGLLKWVGPDLTPLNNEQ